MIGKAPRSKAVTAGEGKSADRAAWSFGRLLAWHLTRGTRPGGVLDKPGRQWSPKAFADAVGLGDRTIRYWIRDEHLPPEIETIERVLFGNDVRFAEWRLELRNAHSSGWNDGVGKDKIELVNERLFAGVPARAANFTGRIEELDQLDVVLAKNQAVAVVQAVGRAAVRGLGGVGKTSLAVEYAHRFRDLYAGVWWCPAETRAGLLTSLAALAIALGVGATKTEVEESAKAALQRLSQERVPWLLVYDNVTAPDEVADLLPASGARVLITSRFADWREWAEEVALDVLPIDEAISFLQSRSGRKDEDGAAVLAETLGRLPLALDHAAAICRRMQMSFRTYASKADQLLASQPPGVGYPRSVATTFDLALGTAAEHSGAESLMNFLAHCGPERIPMTLIWGALDDEAELLDALAALVDVSLVRHDPFEDGTSAVTVHRLVQSVARTRSENNASSIDAVQRVIARLLTIYPDDGYYQPHSRPLAQLTPHLLARRESGDASKSNTAVWASLLNRAGSYFQGRGFYRQAAPFRLEALAIREKLLGLDHLDTALSLNDVGLLLYARGQFKEALPYFQRALAVREKTLGPMHPDTAISLNNLALVFRAQGNFAQGRPLFERALAIHEKQLGPNHPHTARSLYNLGVLLQAEEDIGRARPLFERALRIREAALGPNHPDTATSLNGFGGLLLDGHLLVAKPLLERALAIREEVLGPSHPDTAVSLNDVALLTERQGEHAKARGFYERALAIDERTLGPEHPNTNVKRCNLARILITMRLSKEALPLAEAALTHHNNSLGSGHAWTVTSAIVTADVLSALERTSEAEALLDRFGLAQQRQGKRL